MSADRAALAALYELACDTHPFNAGRRDAWFGGAVAEYFSLDGAGRAVYEIADEKPSGPVHGPRHAQYPDAREKHRHRLGRRQAAA